MHLLKKGEKKKFGNWNYNVDGGDAGSNFLFHVYPLWLHHLYVLDIKLEHFQLNLKVT